MIHPPRFLASAITALTVTITTPSVEAEPPVLESHVGARPADADAILGLVAAELSQAGYESARATARKIDARLSLPGRATSDSELDESIRRIDAGYRLVVAGEFERAVSELEEGLARLRGASASLAGNDRGRDAVMRALVGLALSHKRLGRSVEATRVMAELVRSFPDREISYKDYGPEPRDLFNRVVTDLKENGLGSLTVEVDDAETVVFLNERYLGVGAVTTSDLYPGTYRVYLQQGNQRGRVHEIDVEAGGPTTLSLSWSFDAALRTDEGVAALVFDDPVQRKADESRLAVRVGRALDAGSVAVIGFRDIGGHRQVVGRIYYVDTRKEARSATVSLDPVKPSAEHLRALGRYLAGDESVADLVQPLEAEGAPGSGSAPGRAEPTFATWKWLTLTAGICAIAGGVTLVAIHRDAFDSDGNRNVDVRDTQTAGLITGAAGVALTGLSIYMFVRDRRDASVPAHGVAIVPTAGGAMLGMTGRF